MVLTRAVREWLASLPKDREFSLEWAYNRLLDDYPRYAVDRSRASGAIIRTGKFDSWVDGDGCRMFKYRGPKA